MAPDARIEEAQDEHEESVIKDDQGKPEEKPAEAAPRKSTADFLQAFAQMRSGRTSPARAATERPSERWTKPASKAASDHGDDRASLGRPLTSTSSRLDFAGMETQEERTSATKALLQLAVQGKPPCLDSPTNE